MDSSWVFDEVVDEFGADAPEWLVSEAEQWADERALAGTDRDREALRGVLRFYRRASRASAKSAQAKASAPARGLQQRRNAAAADVLRFARADMDLIAFRAANGLPIRLDGVYEPFRAAALARTRAALPRPALEALVALEDRLATLIGWTREEVGRFVLGDVSPESLPWREGPLVEALLAVSLDQLNQYCFVANRKKPGVTWIDLSSEWDLRQPPGERYGGGVGYKQFCRDVKRTAAKLRRNSLAKDAARRLLAVARAEEREASARAAETLGTTLPR